MGKIFVAIGLATLSLGANAKQNSACDALDPAARYAASALAYIYGSDDPDAAREKICTNATASVTVESADSPVVEFRFPKSSCRVELSGSGEKFSYLSHSCAKN